MNVTRQHVRHKLPVQVFYNKQHLKLIDFSLGGAGAEIGKIDPPEATTVPLAGEIDGAIASCDTVW